MTNVFYRYRFFYGGRAWDAPIFRITAAVRNAVDGQYNVGLSFCNKTDLKKWSKQQARKLAEERLSNQDTVVTVNQREVDLHRGVFNAAMFKAMTSSKDRPQWFPVKLWSIDVESFDNCFDKY